MRIGASTSCFYPLETEKALQTIVNLGFECTEIFINSPSELEDSFIKELSSIVRGSGTEVVSIHPFSSFLETNCIFTEYKRRYDDFIGIYEKTCHAAANLGAKLIVIHGALEKPKIHIPDERYFERFRTLIEIGKREGIMVCQENVNRFKSQKIEFCKKMRNNIGDDFHMVFDIKQAIRANQNPFGFIEEFGDNIVHLHISDNDNSRDCLPPGKGQFDLKRVKEMLDKSGYKGDSVIEIYSADFDVENELRKSKEYLEAIWHE